MRFTKEMLAAKEGIHSARHDPDCRLPRHDAVRQERPGVRSVRDFASVSTHLLSRSPRPRAGSEHASLRHRSK